MKREDIFKAISDISPEFIEEMDEKIVKAKHTNKSFIILVCAVVGLAGLSSAAAVKSLLGRGMNELQIDESQQQSLIETGAAITYTSESTSETEATTNAVDYSNVNVFPVSVVADERCAFISFKVTGFTFDDTINEPWFDQIFVYEDESMQKELDCDGGSFYNGINELADGSSVYEDGTPVKFDSRGMPILRYYDSEGSLYCMYKVSGHSVDYNMLGKTIYVRLVNLGEMYKCEMLKSTGKEWTFTLEMPKESSSVHKEIGKPIPDSPYTLDSIDISPISIRMNFSSKDGSSNASIPMFSGVKLKDGTLLGIGDDLHQSKDGKKAYSNCFFVRAIDPEKVKSIMICPDFDNNSGKTVDIEI